MAENLQRYACGVSCVFTDETGTNGFSEALKSETGRGGFGFALIFFSKSAISPDDIVDMVSEAAPGLRYAACSTAGEITPKGVTEGQIMALLFPFNCFHVQANRISGLSRNTIEDIVAKVGESKRRFLRDTADGQARSSSSFALCLMDGMSFMEEALTAAIHWGLDDIPLLGGSAGDDLNFRDTSLILDGTMERESAVLLLFHSTLPFHIFKTENFVPTSDKLVVTKSDPDKRVVHELNARPAAQVYADVIGANPNTLAPQSFASHPLVVRVGGQYYCRSIQKVNEDNSLSFFCAIDDGIVLTVAEPTGMARTTSTTFETVREEIGNIDFVLGFDCVLRRIDARNRQITRKISVIYEENNVIGFNTYGEQFGSMHLNQTFTGIAFGHAPAQTGQVR